MEAAPRTGDAVFDDGGIRFFLPAESRLLLDGVTIDFAETPAQSGLVFHDPKAANCGCKSSDSAGQPVGGAHVTRRRAWCRQLEGREQRYRRTTGALRRRAARGGLAGAAEQICIEAGLAYHDDAVAERYLRSAQALAPDHAAVLIGLYRFYFYKGRLAEALEIAALPDQGGAREQSAGRLARRREPRTRYSAATTTCCRGSSSSRLKGYAYLQMRLGNLEEGRAAVDEAAGTRSERQDRRQGAARRSRTRWGRTMTMTSTKPGTGCGNEVDCGVRASGDAGGGPLPAQARLRQGSLCPADRPILQLESGARQRYLAHPHFEVRAIAAKHADIFLLPPLLDDPEETVRWNAARRLPKRLILRLRNDPHREVRIRIVTLLDDAGSRRR